MLKEIKALKTVVDTYNGLLADLENIEILITLGKEEQDTTLLNDAISSFKTFVPAFESFKTQSLLSGEFDAKNIIFTINSGAGGTDAQDWAEILLRMYTRYASDKGFGVSIIDYQEGDDAGIKSVALEITGEFAYGNFKSEKGVHRLVRLSPFDSSGKRHTSFASCNITPIFDEEIHIEIKDEDLKVDTYRASGAGGQHVNKTESAIRITHLPTGIVVQCQNDRSQHKNRDTAMKVLKSKLYEKERLDKEKTLENIKGKDDDNAFGSQIRSYVFHPYNLVKDHRTEVETGNVKAVIDGDIELFVSAFLRKQAN